MGSEMDDEMLKLYAFVIISMYRTKVMLSLKEKPKIPSQIAKEIDYNPNSLSNLLTQLRKKGLIEIVNPEVRKGRIYRLTPLGEEISSNL